MKAKDRILKAADRVFGEMGFDAATVRRIAQISKTNKALIHYHFGSKEGLFAGVLEYYFNSLAQTLHGAIISNGPLSERMIRLFDRYLDFLEKNRNFVHIIHREIAGGKQKEKVIAHMTPLFQFVLQGIREAYPKTKAGDLSAEQLLISAYGMIIIYFTCSGIVKNLIGSDPLSPKNLKIRRQHLYQMFAMIIRNLNLADKNAAKLLRRL
jgi:AcrR family transcriptional regulator